MVEAVEELVDELPASVASRSGALTDGLVERLEVVVRFLAVLELYKQGIVDLDQPRRSATSRSCGRGEPATPPTSPPSTPTTADAHDG